MASTEPPNRIEQILQERLPEPIREMRAFEDWFDPLAQHVQPAVMYVRDQVDQALRAARREVHQQERVHRGVWDVTGTDGASLMKSVPSIRSKLGRELAERIAADRLPPGRMSIDQIEQILFNFPDLGRFRVICDLTLDVAKAIEVLLSPTREMLLGCFPLRGEIKDFTYDLKLRRLVRGHRAQQFVATVQEPGRPVLVEIQIMTLLQNAWDRRNHPLYEWEREANPISPQLRFNDIALAEALHLVDLQATRNWQEFLEERKRSQ